jgi:hypothetical protein
VRAKSSVIAAVILGASVMPAAAQAPAARMTAEQRESRYQVGVMERVFEGAVEHSVTMTRDRLQAVLPNETQLISESARVRGFRLDGYGAFFDVVVPSFEVTMPWAIRTLDQNDLGLDSALKALRTHIDAAGDVKLEQALRRVELQVGPARPPATGAQGAVTASASASAPGSQPQPVDQQILSDPNEAFRTEVRRALMDAMLDHSSSLGIGPNEWLTVAARRNADRSPLTPADSEAVTVVIRVRGSDLAAFLARQITREDALKRIEVRVF